MGHCGCAGDHAHWCHAARAREIALSLHNWNATIFLRAHARVEHFNYGAGRAISGEPRRIVQCFLARGMKLVRAAVHLPGVKGSPNGPCEGGFGGTGIRFMSLKVLRQRCLELTQ